MLPAVFADDAGGLPRRFLAQPGVAWLGLVSYGIFLWHYAVTLDLGFDGDGLSFWPLLAVTLAISIAAAAISYYALERPLLRLKYRSVAELASGRPAQSELSADYPPRPMASAPEDTGYRFIAPVVGPDDERRFTDSGIEVDGLYDADDVGPGPRGAARRARRIPLHPRDPRGHVPRPALDDAPVRRASPRPRTPTSATAT